MKGYLYLKTFTVFSSFQLIVGKTIETIEEEAVDEINDNLENASDGEQYINKIVNGEEISERPGILMFTAPYKLCDGGCNGSDGGNIALQFPLFIGEKGREAYRRVFNRDFNVLHANSAAPFKKPTSKATTTTTPCIVFKVADTTTTTTTTKTSTTTTTTTTTTTEPPTTTTTITTTTTEPPTTQPAVRCPYYPPDVCLKNRKKKKNYDLIIVEKVTATPCIVETTKTEDNFNNLVETARVTDGNDVADVTALRMENDISTLEDIGSDYNFYDHGF